MSRHDESIGRMPNPSQYFLEWNSEKSLFCYYSKEKEERISFPLPFRFLALKFVKTITGFNEESKQGIYANEVTNTNMEHFRVYRRDGIHIATGLYSNIKDQVNKAGGRFTSSIYAMSDKGVLINIQLKGLQIMNFDEISKHGSRWKDEFIQVGRFQTKIHKGADTDTEYTLPVFEFGGSLNEADNNRATAAYKLLMEYFNSRNAHSGTTSRPSPQPTPAAPAIHTPEPPAGMFAPNDDLPF